MPYSNFFLILMLFGTLQCPFDDLVLHTHMELCEEGAETGYPDHKVAVFFGVFLASLSISVFSTLN